MRQVSVVTRQSRLGGTHEEERGADLEVGTVVTDDTAQDGRVHERAIEKGGMGARRHRAPRRAESAWSRVEVVRG